MLPPSKYNKQFKNWNTAEQKKKTQIAQEDAAAIRLLVGMKRRTKIPMAYRERIARLMVSEAKKRIALLGWDARNGDALKPYFTKTRIGISVDPKAVFLLYQNNGLREFIPWGIQKYLDAHKGTIHFKHSPALKGYEQVRVPKQERAGHIWGFSNREAKSYMFREALWLEKWYGGDRKITDGRIYGKDGTEIRGPQKKVGEPAEVKVPVGYATVAHREGGVDWEKFRELKAEKDARKKGGAGREEWEKKREELVAKLNKWSDLLEKWDAALDKKTVPDKLRQVSEKKHMPPQEIMKILKKEADELNQKIIELADSDPESEGQWDKSRWKEANTKGKPDKITFKKIILWRTVHKDKWFGHKAVKGLHFLDRAMLDAVEQELGRNGKLRKNWYALDKEMYRSRKNISANEKEFTYPNPDNPKATFPSLQTNNKGQSRRTYLRSRVVTNYYLDAIYIQI